MFLPAAFTAILATPLAAVFADDLTGALPAAVFVDAVFVDAVFVDAVLAAPPLAAACADFAFAADCLVVDPVLPEPAVFPDFAVLAVLAVLPDRAVVDDLDAGLRAVAMPGTPLVLPRWKREKTPGETHRAGAWRSERQAPPLPLFPPDSPLPNPPPSP
jgi:hypothetical protein